MATGDMGFGRPPVPSMLAQFSTRDPLSRLRGAEEQQALQQLASVPGLSIGGSLPHAPGEPDLQIMHDGSPVSDAPAKASRPRSPAKQDASPATPPLRAKPAEKRIVFAFSRDPEIVTVNLKDGHGDIEHALKVPFDHARSLLPVLQRLAKIEDLTGELTEGS